MSEKVVRDIWKGHTWIQQTSRLDPTRFYATRTVGRPKCSRDSKPRASKALLQQTVQNPNKVLSESLEISHKVASPCGWSDACEDRVTGAQDSTNSPNEAFLRNECLELSNWSDSLCIKKMHASKPTQPAESDIDALLYTWEQRGHCLESPECWLRIWSELP